MENNDLKQLLGNIFASLNEEQKKKVEDCETMDQLMNLLGDMGVELPDEFLDEVGGGLNLSFRGFTYPQHLARIRPRDLFAQFNDLGAEFLDLSDKGAVQATHANLVGTPSLEVTNLGGIPGQQKGIRV